MVGKGKCPSAWGSRCWEKRQSPSSPEAGGPGGVLGAPQTACWEVLFCPNNASCPLPGALSQSPSAPPPSPPSLCPHSHALPRQAVQMPLQSHPAVHPLFSFSVWKPSSSRGRGVGVVGGELNWEQIWGMGTTGDRGHLAKASQPDPALYGARTLPARIPDSPSRFDHTQPQLRFWPATLGPDAHCRGQPVPGERGVGVGLGEDGRAWALGWGWGWGRSWAGPQGPAGQ